LGVGIWSNRKSRFTLITAGDEFDEADFNVPPEEHTEEIFLETATSSGDSKRASTLKTLENRKVPQLRPHEIQIDSAADKLRKSPSRKGSFNSALPVPPNQTRVEARDPLRKDELVRSKHLGRPAGPLPTGSLSTTSSNALLDPGGPPRFLQEKHEPQTHLGDNIRSLDGSDSVDHAAPVGFYTARAAETVQNGSSLPSNASAFNPHLESPSIRKTAGIDHTKTKPVGRDSIPISPSVLPPRPNFINPQIDKNRKVGMPIGAASPLQNRNSYKPLQIKRPAEQDSGQ
jgi:DNA repair and recombination protein RAD52